MVEAEETGTAAAAATTEVIQQAPFVDTSDVSPLLLRRLSDESLGRRLAAGEAAAFDELYRRYVHRLAAYGAHLLGDAAAGDDVAQSTLLKAYGALRDGRAPEHVKAWLYRIAHNTAVDLLARRREQPSDGLPDRAAPSGGPTTGALVAALAALPDRQRHVYVLRELHGLRIDETAAELALSPAQVEQALFAARNRLAEHLVFGDRLNCVAVQRLAAGPLDGDERRALRTHLRSCPECRQSVGAAGRPFGFVPADALGWLRALPGLLAGGGAPAAVKVGAVVATATLAGGAPIAYEINREHNPRPVAAHAPAPARAPVRRPARRHVVTLPQAQPVADVGAVTIASHPTRPVASGSAATVIVQRSHDARGETVHRESASHPDGERRGSSHESSDGGQSDAPAPTTTTTSGHDGGASAPVTTAAALPATTTTTTPATDFGGGGDLGGSGSGSTSGSDGSSGSGHDGGSSSGSDGSSGSTSSDGGSTTPGD